MKKIILIFLYLLPKSLYGKILRFFFELENPVWFVSILKKIFVGFYKIDLFDVEKSIDEYKSVQKLFCRKLKKNARIATSAQIVSPVDGFVSECGLLEKNQLIQAKGLYYTINDLLPAEYSDKFENGWYSTIYLAPYNYHRIHSPVSGIIKKFYYQPGKFWPVNSITVPFLRNLFVENERVTTFIETVDGLVAVVKVAALGVGNIPLSYYTSYDASKRNNYKIGFTFLENDIKINKLDELGMFSFGSTVILICENRINRPNFSNILKKTIRTGEAIN